MRYFIYSFMFVVMFSSSMVFAGGSIPFASDLKSEIKNYNRASSTMATSGALGKGAVEELAGLGIKTIIDLRTAAEGTATEKAKAESVEIKYINIPVTGKGIIHSQFTEFVNAIETAEQPVLVHCGSGNRVGAMLTMYYLSKGIDKDKAFDIGRTAGMKPSFEEKILMP